MQTTNTHYYIYILKAKTTSRCNIYYAVNFPEAIEKTKAKLVYYRCYDNIVDALGHKLFLEQLSEASLKRLIRMHNSGNKDLRQHIQSISP